MQNIVNGIDKGTKAGLFSLDEVLAMAKELDHISNTFQQLQANSEAQKQAAPAPTAGVEGAKESQDKKDK